MILGQSSAGGRLLPGFPGRRRSASQVVVSGLLLWLVSGSSLANWHVVDGPHFEVVGQGSEKTTLRLARDLETFHAFLTDLLEVRGGAAPLPTKVVLFANERSFEKALRVDLSDGDFSVIGLFHGGADSNLVLMHTGSSVDNNDVLYHEYVHYLARSTMPQAPWWLNEGLAEFFSTFQRDGAQVLVGKPIYRHVRLFAANPMIPTSQLISGTGEMREGSRVGMLYAQSWMLTHLLMTTSEETRAQLMEYLGEIRRGTEPQSAFRTAFGLEADQMDAKLWGYLKRGVYPYYGMPNEVRDLVLEARPLDEAELEFQLGDVQLRRSTPQLEAARQRLERALELEPGHSRALAALGRVHELTGDRERAGELYARAVAGDPQAPEPWFLYARFELDRLPRAFGAELSAEQAERLAEVRRALGRAIALKPDYGPAFALLARTYLLEPERAGSGVAAATRAYSLMRYRFDVVRDLALLTAAAGAPGRAFALLDGPFRDLTDETATSTARRDLAQLELTLVEQLVGEQPGEAAERLRGLHARFPDGMPESLAAWDAKLTERVGDG